MKYIIHNPEYNNDHQGAYTLSELRALYPILKLRVSNTYYNGGQVACIRDQDNAEIAIDAQVYANG